MYAEGVTKPHPTYQLCSKLSRLNSRNKVYIAFDIDIVVAEAGAFFCPDLENLQHIAFQSSPRIGWRKKAFDLHYEAFDTFPNLKTITLFVEDFYFKRAEKNPAFNWQSSEASMAERPSWIGDWRLAWTDEPQSRHAKIGFSMQPRDIARALRRIRGSGNRPNGWRQPTIYLAKYHSVWPSMYSDYI